MLARIRRPWWWLGLSVALVLTTVGPVPGSWRGGGGITPAEAVTHLGRAPAPPAGEPAPAPASAMPAAQPLANVLRPDGTLPVGPAATGTYDPTGWQLAASPTGGPPRFVRAAASRPSAAPVAAPAAPGDQNWSVNGLSQVNTAPGAISALAVLGSDLYVGGSFFSISGVAANAIARYTPATNTWTAHGAGLTGNPSGLSTCPAVAAIAAVGTDLYVGGCFTQAGSGPANNVAKFDTLTSTWSALSGGTNNQVRALAVLGTDLYAGGVFSQTNGIVTNGIARYTPGSNTWAAVGSGISGGGAGFGTVSAVNALTVLGTDLYAGGGFTQMNGVAANSIVRYTPATGTWSALGSGVIQVPAPPGGSSIAGSVNALAVSGTDLYVGGGFFQAGGVSSPNVAKYTPATSTWTGINTSGSLGVAPVNALTAVGTDLYVGGYFSSIGGTLAINIARYNTLTATWSALGGGVGNPAPPTGVNALAAIGPTVYVGGGFAVADGAAANAIAKYSTGTATWSALGSGPIGSSSVPASANALAVLGGDIYVGGTFGVAGGVTSPAIARYTPASNTWAALGAGLQLANVPGAAPTVSALLVVGSDLYVGGSFDHAGAVAASNVARYTPGTSTWAALGSGVSGGSVNALAAVGSDLYVGGDFTQAGGSGIAGVARYTPGTTSWAALGTGLASPSGTASVSALAAVGTDLYVGGGFTQAGGLAAANIAKFATTSNTWSTVGPAPGPGLSPGLGGAIKAITVFGSDLYIGGFISPANLVKYVPATNAFVSVGGVNNPPSGGFLYAVASLATVGNDLYVGGGYSSAGGLAAANIARYTPTTNTWTPLGSGVSLPTGNNVTACVCALATVTSTLYVGGLFTQAGGQAARSLASYNTAGATSAPALGDLHLIQPVRVVDTRPAPDGPIGFNQLGIAIQPVPLTTGPFLTGQNNLFKIGGQTFGGTTVPTDATGLLLNVTVIKPPAAGPGGFVVVYPGDAAPPTASTVNPDSAISHNFWSVGLPTTGPAAGTIAVSSVGGTFDARNLAIDLVGYYQPAALPSPSPARATRSARDVPAAGNLKLISPTRVLDTRSPDGSIVTTGFDGVTGNAITAGPFAQNQTRKFRVGGKTFGATTFPGDVSGLLAHVTVIQSSGSGGYTTLLPGDAVVGPNGPGTSTVNPSTAVAFNSWAVGVPTTGADTGNIEVFTTNAGQHVAIDVLGYFSPSNPASGNLTLVIPGRVLDTRAGGIGSGITTTGYDQTGAPIVAGQLTDGTTRRYTVAGKGFGALAVPGDVKALLLNVTLAQAGPGGGFVTVFPGDLATAPNASTVNPGSAIAASFWASGVPVPLAGTPPAANPGTLGVLSVSGPRDVIIDVLGYIR